MSDTESELGVGKFVSDASAMGGPMGGTRTQEAGSDHDEQFVLAPCSKCFRHVTDGSCCEKGMSICGENAKCIKNCCLSAVMFDCRTKQKRLMDNEKRGKDEMDGSRDCCAWWSCFNIQFCVFGCKEMVLCYPNTLNVEQHSCCHCGWRLFYVCCFGLGPTASWVARCLGCFAASQEPPVILNGAKLLMNLPIHQNNVTVEYLYAIAKNLKDERDNRMFSWPHHICGYLRSFILMTLTMLFSAYIFVELEHDVYEQGIQDARDSEAALRNVLPVADKMDAILTALQAHSNTDASVNTLISELQAIKSEYSPTGDSGDWYDQNHKGDEGPYTFENPWKWDGSIFYCVTIATTIGYGNFGVQTDEGRTAAIFLSFPLLWTMVWFMRRNLSCWSNGIHNRNCCGFVCPEPPQLLSFSISLVTLIAYLALSAMIWEARENCSDPETCSPVWDYTGSLYFAWVTISTIGFGDYVPSKARGSASDELAFWPLIIFIFVGLHIAAYFLNECDNFIAWMDDGRDWNYYWAEHDVPAETNNLEFYELTKYNEDFPVPDNPPILGRADQRAGGGLYPTGWNNIAPQVKKRARGDWLDRNRLRYVGDADGSGEDGSMGLDLGAGDESL